MLRAYITVAIYLIVNTANAQWNLITAEDDSVFFDAVYFTDDSTGFVVGTWGHNNNPGGVILKTTDGGLSWDTTIISSLLPISIHFPSNDTGYVAGSGDSVLKTVDAGQTWAPLKIGEPVNSIFFLDNQIGYASRMNNIILIKTTDGGLNWFEDTTIPNLGGSQVFFPSPNTGYIIAGWAIFKTTDGGSNWSKSFIDITDTTMTTDTSYESIFFVNETLGFIGGSIAIETPFFTNYGVIAKTTDGGLTWNAKAYPEILRINSIYFVNASIGYAVGTGTILKTTDGGENWYPQQVTASFKGVYCTNDTTCYAMSSWPGAIYKTTNGGGPVIIGVDNVNSKKENEVKIYPNPTTWLITVTGLPKETTRTMVYNILGELVHRQELNGSNDPLIDLSALPGGLYVIQLQNRQMTLRKKIIKQ
ncbi:MAG: hypothetical protein COC01_07545 [Bacteroidetes bacterium]|nr:MAG: hypothetical protein COC01_07545 [Bacteroidota bacterium]